MEFDCDQTVGESILFRCGSNVGQDMYDPKPLPLRGLYFDGVDDYISMSGHQLENPFTFVLWMYAMEPGSIISLGDIFGNSIEVYFKNDA